jgi:WD40 repeat protein
MSWSFVSLETQALNMMKIFLVVLIGGCSSFSNGNDQLMVECQLNDRNAEYAKLTFGDNVAIDPRAFHAFDVKGEKLKRLQISEKGCVYASKSEINSDSLILVVGSVNSNLYHRQATLGKLQSSPGQVMETLSVGDFERPQFSQEPKVFVQEFFSPVVNPSLNKKLLGFVTFTVDGKPGSRVIMPGDAISDTRISVADSKEGSYGVKYQFHDIFTPDYKRPIEGALNMVVDRTKPQITLDLPRTAGLSQVNPKEKIAPQVADSSDYQQYYCVESSEGNCEFVTFDGQYEAPEKGVVALRFKAVDKAGNTSDEVKARIKVFNQKAIDRAKALLVEAASAAKSGQGKSALGQLQASQNIYDTELKQEEEKSALRDSLLSGAVNSATSLNLLKGINGSKLCSPSLVALSDKTFVCMSRSGNELIAFDLDKKVEVGAEKIDFKVRSIFSSKASKRIMVIGRDGEYQAIDLATSMKKANPYGKLAEGAKPLNFDENSGSFVAYSEKDITVFSKDGGSAKAYSIPTKDLRFAHVLEDSSVVAAYAVAPEIRIFSKDSTELKTFDFPGGIDGVQFSPAKDFIVFWSTAGQMKRIDLKPMIAEVFAEKLEQPLSAVSISHDAKYLSVANNSILKRYGADGSPLGSSTGHEDAILDVTYSKDDEYVATASNDGTVRVWKGAGRDLHKVALPSTAGRPIKFLTNSFDITKPVLVLTDSGLIVEILLAPITIHQTSRMRDRIVGHVATSGGKIVQYLSRDGQIRSLDIASKVEKELVNVKAANDGFALNLCQGKDDSLVIGFDSGVVKSFSKGKVSYVISQGAGKTTQMICGDSIYLVTEERDVIAVDASNKVANLGNLPDLLKLYSFSDKYVMVSFDGNVQVGKNKDILKTFSGCDTALAPELNQSEGLLTCATENGFKAINLEKLTEEAVKTVGGMDRVYLHGGHALGFSSGRVVMIDKQPANIQLHDGQIKGLVSVGDKLISFGDDQKVKLWKFNGNELIPLGEAFHLQNFFESATVDPANGYVVFSTWTIRYSSRYFGVEANDNRLMLMPLSVPELIKRIGEKI